MSDKQTVSIIVPIYNAEETIDRCLRSLQCQTYKNIEVLMLDDGSTDNSAMICKEYSEHDKRFKLFELKSIHNVAAVRNIGLKKYTGQYLMFVDADDLVSNNNVKRLYNVLINSGCNIATCIALDTTDNSIDQYSCNINNPPRIISIAEYNFAERWSHRVVWEAIYKREIIHDIAFDENYYCSTDTLFIAELLKREKTIAHISDPLYVYIYHEGSIAHRPFDERRFSDVLVWERIAYSVFKDGPELPRRSAELTFLTHAMRGLKEIEQHNIVDVALAERLIHKFIERRITILKMRNLGLITRLQFLAIAYMPKLYCHSYRFIKRKLKH